MSTSTATRVGSPRVTGTRVVGGLVLGVLGLAAAVVVLVGFGALIPVFGPVSGHATVLVPAIGPPLVVAGALVAAGALLVRRRLAAGRGARVATGIGIGAVLGTAALLGVVASIVLATVQAGGSVDLLRDLAPTDPTVAPDERVVYTTDPSGQPLHLSVYRPPGSALAGGPVPVLVYVHGGGWIAGSDLDAAADMRRFADAGRLVVSVQYTLATPQRPTWDLAGPQVGCALAAVAARAPALGGDPARLVVAGDSAGGQLAIATGYRAAAGTAPSSCGGAVPAPRGVVVQYPAVDVVDAVVNGRAPGRPDLDPSVFGRSYTGGRPDEVPDRYAAVSGAAAITPAAPPTLVLLPGRDDLVPPAGVRRFADEARAGGVAVDVVEIPFANHAYDIHGTGSLGNQVRVSLTERWLADRGW